MKLVMIINHTDGYTFFYEETIPIVYESKESFIRDFQAQLDNLLKLKETNEYPSTIKIDKLELETHDLISYDSELGYITQMPEILTIDEWFENRGTL